MASHPGKTDWRNVRFSDGLYLAENLCNTCSRLNCEVRGEHQYCSFYAPTIAFNPPLQGFYGVFNTFRLGKASAKNLKKGQVVGLLDTRSGELFGHASIVGLVSGDKELVALDYATENHNMKNSNLPQDDAAGELLSRLYRRYGKRIYDRTETASVVRMMRLTSEF